jgi:molybdate transport system ATP-binding protein
VILKAGQVIAHGPLAETLARLDLPIHLGDERAVVLECVVAEQDEKWHLTRVEFAGGSLWIRALGIPQGRRVRVRVPSEGVSLCLKRQEDTSILNILPGQVEEVADEDHPGLSMVRVRIGETAVLARVTKRSVAALALNPGETVWIQIKSVAVVK